MNKVKELGTKGSQHPHQYSEIWTEKYRPKTFEEFKGQSAIVERVKAMAQQKNIQNMLFVGPAGIGKTTLALIIAKKLFGQNWKENLLETNASDERGIDVVREKIKEFARTKSIASDLPKIVYLDECDALTREAQNALRRTMETYSNSCRFILSANIPSKIIDPIKSRCAIFKFKPLSKEEIEEIVENVAKKEGLNVDKETIHLLYNHCGGDVRHLQNLLQSTSSISKDINNNTISEFITSVESKDIQEILDLALNKKFIESRNKLLGTMLNHGLSGLDIIKQIQREAMNLKTDETKKLNIIEKCGEIEFRLVEGSDDYTQLEALLAFIAK